MGQCGGCFDAGGQLVGQDEEVVDEACRGHGGETPPYVRPQQPFRVGLSLDLVADALEVSAAGEFPEAGQFVGDVGTGEIGPADDTGDQVVCGGQRQELRGLLGDGDRLDEYRPVHSGGGCLEGEVGDGEVPPDRAVLGDPVLVAHRQVPEVVVRVDRHGSSHTTGRPAAAPWSE
ncbi:hypothetical protein QF037_001618 [Streptomyces canus]|nr:hypothetical protein [Streptomyces canus]